MDDDLDTLRRDYLNDVTENVVLLRHHARGLNSQESFRTSFPVLLFLAHQLKGSGGSLGFPRISDLAKEITDQLNLFLDDESAPRPTPEQLASELTRVAAELESEVASNSTTAR